MIRRSHFLGQIGDGEESPSAKTAKNRRTPRLAPPSVVYLPFVREVNFFLSLEVGRDLFILKLLQKNPRSGFWIVAQGKQSAALGTGKLINAPSEEGAGKWREWLS